MRLGAIALVLAFFPHNLLFAQEVLTQQTRLVASGGGHLWGEISGLLPMANGSIVAIFPQEGVLRIFSGNGGDAQIIGRPGSGPGEFRRIASAGTVDGLLWVHEWGNARIQIFNASGGLKRSFRVTGVHRPNAASGDSWVGVLRTVYALGQADSLLIEVSEGNPKSGSASKVVYESSSSGYLVRRLLELPSEDCRRKVTIRGAPGSFKMPFCAPPVFAVSPDGTHAALLKVTTGDNSHYCLSAIVVRTGRSTETCLPYRPVEIPAAELDSALDILAEHAPNDEFRHAIERFDDPPTTFPAFDRLLVADDGTMWIREWAPHGGHTWRRHAPGQTKFGRVRLTSDLAVQAVSANILWAVRTTPSGDEDIVEVTVSPPI